MIEKCLIEHCAPTLASLKAANLFNACCEEEENIDLQILTSKPKFLVPPARRLIVGRYIRANPVCV